MTTGFSEADVDVVAPQLVLERMREFCRRKHGRQKVGSPVEAIHLRTDSLRHSQAQLLDVSAGGVGIITARQVLPEEFFAVCLRSGDKPPLLVLYKAAWCVEITPHAYRVGAAFVDAFSPEGDIAQPPARWVEMARARNN